MSGETMNELLDTLNGQCNQRDHEVLAGSICGQEEPPWSAAMMDNYVQGDLKDGAMLFYELITKTKSPEYVIQHIDRATRIKDAVSPQRPLRFVIWIRHHWVLAELIQDECLKIYDSARSQLVEKDLTAMAVLLRMPIPEFPIVPQQLAGSEECGVFVYAFYTLLESGKQIVATNEHISLRPVVEAVRKGDSEMEKAVYLIFNKLKPMGVHAGGPRYALVTWHRERDSEKHTDVGVITDERKRKRNSCTYLLMEKESRLARLSNEHRWSYPSSARKDFIIVSVEETTEDGVERWRRDAVTRGEEVADLLLGPKPPTSRQPATKPKPKPTAKRGQSSANQNRQSEDGEEQSAEQLRTSSYGKWAEVEPKDLPDTATNISAVPKVSEFLSWKLRTYEEAKNATPPLVWGACTEAVHKGHIRELCAFQRWLKEMDETEVERKSIDALISLYLGAVQNTRKVTWTTVERVGTTMIGALSYAKYYADGPGVGAYAASKWCGFKHSLKTVKRQAAKSSKPDPKAATFKDVQVGLSHLKSTGDRAFLIIAWFSAQRPGCISQLKTRWMRPVEVQGTPGITLTIDEGKRASKTGRKDCTHVLIQDQALASEVSEYVCSRKGTFYLFPRTSSWQIKKMKDRIIAAVKKSDPKLGWLSMRRGTLQCLAKEGKLTLDELLEYSHHSSKETLLRYLEDGIVPSGEAQSAFLKSSVLGGETNAPDAGTRFDGWLTITNEGSISCTKPPKPDTNVDRNEYTIHLPPETKEPIDIDEVRRFAQEKLEDERSKQWLEIIRFLFDDTLYRNIPWDQEASLSLLNKEHTQRMEALLNVQGIDPQEAKNIIKRFLAAEDDKERWRLISHPILINFIFSRAKGILEGTMDTMNKANAKRRESWEDVLKYGGALELDFRSYFERFPLGEGVQPYFCFQTPSGWFKNLRMPTGATFSSAVGTATTRLLLRDIESPHIAIRHNIDNVRFAGPKEQVVEAAERFVQNCARMKVVLNDIDFNKNITDQLEAKYSTVNDFFGDVADYEKKTLKARDKQVKRLKTWKERVLSGGGTYRDFFSAYCTALHISEVLGISGTDYWTTRMFFRTCSRELAASPHLWDKKMRRIYPVKEFTEFMDECIRNEPGTIVELPPPKAVVFVDACSQAWGHVQVKGGKIIASGKTEWTDKDKKWINVESSVSTEPTALQRAEKVLTEDLKSEAYVKVTDHEPIAAAIRKGHSPNPTYAACIEASLRETNLVDTRYIEGESNCADGVSRLRELDEEDERKGISWAARILESYKNAPKKAFRIVGNKSKGGAGARSFRKYPPLNVASL